MSESDDGLQMVVTHYKSIIVSGEDIDGRFSVKVVEWPNGEGADITIATQDQETSRWAAQPEVALTFSQFEALVKAYNEIVGIPTQSKKEGRVLEI